MAISAAAQDVVFLRQLLMDLGEPEAGATKMLTDNQAAIAIGNDHVTKPRTKHIRVRHHFVRELIADGTIVLQHCPGTQMVADALTKALDKQTFEQHLPRLLGLRLRYSPPHVHEHNGLVERSIRTLKESAAAMLHTAPLPQHLKDKLWSAALGHSAWVYNLLPHSQLGMSPYQALFAKPSPLQHVRVFGCKAFVYDHVHTDKSKAFPRRAMEGFYVGFDTRCNAHRIYVKATGRVRSSIHVDFLEEVDCTSQGGALPTSPLTGSNGTSTVQNLWVMPAATASTPDPMRQGDENTPDPMRQGDENTPDPMRQGDSGGAQTSAPLAQSAPTAQQKTSCAVNSKHPDSSTADDGSDDDDDGDGDHSDDSDGYETDILCLRTTLLKNAMVQTHQPPQQPVPKTWRDAMASAHKSKWQEAFVKEWSNMIRHDVFDIVDQRTLPMGVRPIPSKLVFAVKHKPDGSIVHKVRFVCCGNRQTEDTYADVFSPTTRFEALRTFLAATAQRHMLLCQFDVSAAFLHAELDMANVFVRPPQAANLPAGSVLKLRKSLYGLRQAPKLWYASVWKTIGGSGFQRLRSDACIFVNQDRTVMICVHVDDFLVAATTQEHMDRAEAVLAANYDLKNLGAPRQHLSIAISYDRERGVMTLNQHDYIQTVLKQEGLEDCKAKATPLPVKMKLVPVEQAEVDVRHYQSIIGSLLYLAVTTRPDISYATSVLSRFIQQPGKQHLHAARHVCKYLRGTAALAIKYSAGDSLQLLGYTDASHMSDPYTSKGHGGHLFTIAGGPVTWLSKRLPLVTTSSAETEYVAAARAAQAAVYLRQLLQELGFDVGTTPLHMDSQSAMCIATNPVAKGGSKHIRLRYHLLRELIGEGVVKAVYEPGTKLLADMLTKALPRPSLTQCREQVLHAS
ncbi:hypothetical protein PTSG_12513 [Salpingoeca rosetta]|uniref:Integrase catalytic domain-containing protein n=1 Tax=Salpingoeca rosetta (strain ATCC 50818 / BSB-021) TaxID=946362 RepID=F2UFA2_SALR5|nr:uncharacterized protein PTSG_12513 [Salpingoeca rosetta]EGD75302.1 hypothetical protein PTSG_12513 [Salpingoeca rosetta]|eukprot:XP_004992355.1 hypothetical protein PTSG_12513 [Salpingoeca rosetta]